MSTITITTCQNSSSVFHRLVTLSMSYLLFRDFGLVAEDAYPYIGISHDPPVDTATASLGAHFHYFKHPAGGHAVSFGDWDILS